MTRRWRRLSAGSSAEEGLPPFDFGEFSYRSLGITVTVPEEIGRRFPKAVAETFRLLFEGGSPNHLDALSVLYGELSDRDDRFALAGYASSVLHELRHYHDYLATPFGAQSFIDLVLAARYTFPTIGVLAKEQVVGLPLQRWQALSPALHAAYKSQTRSGGFAVAPPADIDRMTKSAQGLLGRLETRLGRPPAEPAAKFSTRHLLETSAAIVQLVQVGSLLGGGATRDFAEYVFGTPEMSLYSFVWRLLNSVAGQISKGARVSQEAASAIVFYALCTEDDPATSHPVERLLAVLKYLASSREVPDRDNVLEILDHTSQMFSIPTLNECLASSSTKTVEFANDLLELAAIEKEEGVPIDPRLYEVFNAWASAHARLAESIRADPFAYFDPVAYINGLESWAAAPVYLSGAGPAFRVDGFLVKNLLEQGWDIVFGIGSRSNRPDKILEASLLIAPETTVGPKLIPPEDALYLSQMIWLTATLWSSTMLSPAHRAIASNVIRTVHPELETLLL